MQFAAVHCVILALFGLSLAVKRPICGLPPADAGSCNASFVLWTFYPEDDECKEFTYGGCGGNLNRFEDPILCEYYCKEQPTWFN